jgi:gamma-glutamylputrescine oxidase
MNLLDANDRPGAYPPSWYAETADLLPPFPPLDGSTRADVCIVGGGYTGLSTAWHLAEAGVDAVVLEAQRVGFGASGRNGGQVGTGHRLDQDVLEGIAGSDAAHRLWALFEEAKALVRELAQRPEIDAEWRDGVVQTVTRAGALGAWRRHVDHLRAQYGATGLETLDRQALADLIGSDVFAGGAVDWSTGHLHSLRLALGLARLATGAGARIHEGSRAMAVEPGRVVTETGVVEAEHVVLAANGYLGDLSDAVARKVMPINNFVVATEPLGARMPLARPVAVTDDRFVVSYWRPTPDGRLLFGGGENYGYRFPADISAVVRRPLARIYPQLADAPVTHAWGGTLALTTSRMPHFERLGPRLWSASGYSGHGVGMAVMAGRLLGRAIAGDGTGFDLMAAIPTRSFPGGAAFRSPLLVLAMGWYGLRDRLGI